MRGPSAQGRAGLALCLASVVLIFTVGLLGASAVMRGYPAPGLARGLSANPADTLITSLLFAALALGAIGVFFGWLALRRGWSPSPRKLMVTGLVSAAVLVLVPPMGSTDIGVYAGYGRLA